MGDLYTVSPIADKPFSYVEISHFSSLLCLWSTAKNFLLDSWFCIKAIYNSQWTTACLWGIVAIFALEEQLGYFFCSEADSTTRVHKHCLTCLLTSVD